MVHADKKGREFCTQGELDGEPAFEMSHVRFLRSPKYLNTESVFISNHPLVLWRELYRRLPHAPAAIDQPVRGTIPSYSFLSAVRRW